VCPDLLAGATFPGSPLRPSQRMRHRIQAAQQPDAAEQNQGPSTSALASGRVQPQLACPRRASGRGGYNEQLQRTLTATLLNAAHMSHYVVVDVAVPAMGATAAAVAGATSAVLAAGAARVRESARTVTPAEPEDVSRAFFSQEELQPAPVVKKDSVLAGDQASGGPCALAAAATTSADSQSVTCTEVEVSPGLEAAGPCMTIAEGFLEGPDGYLQRQEELQAAPAVGTEVALQGFEGREESFAAASTALLTSVDEPPQLRVSLQPAPCVKAEAAQGLETEENFSCVVSRSLHVDAIKPPERLEELQPAPCIKTEAVFLCCELQEAPAVAAATALSSGPGEQTRWQEQLQPALCVGTEAVLLQREAEGGALPAVAGEPSWWQDELQPAPCVETEVVLLHRTARTAMDSVLAADEVSQWQRELRAGPRAEKGVLSQPRGAPLVGRAYEPMSLTGQESFPHLQELPQPMQSASCAEAAKPACAGRGAALAEPKAAEPRLPELALALAAWCWRRKRPRPWAHVLCATLAATLRTPPDRPPAASCRVALAALTADVLACPFREVRGLPQPPPPPSWAVAAADLILATLDG